MRSALRDVTWPGNDMMFRVAQVKARRQRALGAAAAALAAQSKVERRQKMNWKDRAKDRREERQEARQAQALARMRRKEQRRREKEERRQRKMREMAEREAQDGWFFEKDKDAASTTETESSSDAGDAMAGGWFFGGFVTSGDDDLDAAVDLVQEWWRRLTRTWRAREKRKRKLARALMGKRRNYNAAVIQIWFKRHRDRLLARLVGGYALAACALAEDRAACRVQRNVRLALEGWTLARQTLARVSALAKRAKLRAKRATERWERYAAKVLGRAHKAATDVKRCYRGWRARVFVWRTRAAIYLQGARRRQVKRREFVAMMKACKCLQTRVRAWREGKRCRTLFALIQEERRLKAMAEAKARRDAARRAYSAGVALAASTAATVIPAATLAVERAEQAAWEALRREMHVVVFRRTYAHTLLHTLLSCRFFPPFFCDRWLGG